MMTKQQEIGRRGEQIAVDYLLSKDYQILEQNWRWSRAEVDIIAMDADTLIFVEVKTRSYDYYGQPEDSVGAHKETMLADAGAAYMREIGHEWEIRFDIISILLTDSSEPVIKHFPDAFFPGL